jgi:hypothetical protein
MSIFNPIKMAWHGKDITVPANQVLGAIAVVEEVIPMDQVAAIVFNRTRINVAKISQAYGALLRYAGQEVSDEDVFIAMFDSSEKLEQAREAMKALALIVMPPAMLVTSFHRASAGKRKPSRSRSSKPSTRRRSRAAG